MKTKTEITLTSGKVSIEYSTDMEGYIKLRAEDVGVGLATLYLSPKSLNALIATLNSSKVFFNLGGDEDD